jgi:hypothetical protein
MTRDELLARIRKVEALYHDSDFAGERQAALGALGRLQAQLEAAPAPLVEYQFSLPDPWKRQLFCALARPHGLRPYRRKRQRRATVMLRIAKTQLDRVLWPQYLEVSKLLHDYLNDITRDVITRAIHGDLSEAEEEQPGLPLD